MAKPRLILKTVSNDHYIELLYAGMANSWNNKVSSFHGELAEIRFLVWNTVSSE